MAYGWSGRWIRISLLCKNILHYLWLRIFLSSCGSGVCGSSPTDSQVLSIMRANHGDLQRGGWWEGSRETHEGEAKAQGCTHRSTRPSEVEVRPFTIPQMSSVKDGTVPVLFLSIHHNHFYRHTHLAPSVLYCLHFQFWLRYAAHYECVSNCWSVGLKILSQMQS